MKLYFFRKRMMIATLTILSALTIWSPAYAQTKTGTASLTWDANSEPDLAVYKVYMGNSPGSYGEGVEVSTTSHTISGLVEGTYFFAVTAVDTSGNESGFSDEVDKSIDLTAPGIPKNLKVIIKVIISLGE